MPALAYILSRLPSWLQAVVAGAVLALGLAVYDAYVDDPRVRREAMKGFVAQAKLDEANARLAEMTRQREAAQAALDALRPRIAALEAAQAEQDARREQEIKDYEEALASADRVCRLTRSDVDWLRK